MPDDDAKPAGGRFRPGHDPRRAMGRPPRGESAAERVRRLADLDRVVAFLDDVVRDPGQKTEHRLAAAQQLLDRGWGKPMQAVEIEARVEARSVLARPSNWHELSREERVAWLRAHLPVGVLPSGE